MKGADRRLRYRLSRQRLQRRDVPGDAQKWTTRGTAESTTMPRIRWPTELWRCAACESACGVEHVGQHVDEGVARGDSQDLDATKASHRTGGVSSRQTHSPAATPGSLHNSEMQSRAT